MKLRALVLAGWSLAAIGASGCATPPAAASFEGLWRTTHSTRGITGARIFQEAGALRVQLWGACHPSDCDWGQAQFLQLGDADHKQTDRGLASWEDARVTTFKLEGGQLIVELYQTRDPQSPQDFSRFFGVVRMVRES